ncbi:MAG TPA: c-type cytochrome biogenesis protein CcmI [Pseudolabrys sp.]
MTLWLVFALMTAAAIFAVLWPLSRGTAKRGGSDVAVYRDQLDEIARDRASGLIGGAEAEAAKVEVSRRLLGAAEAEAAEATVTTATPAWRRRLVALVALVLLPVGAAVFYLMLGSPQLPGSPLAERAQAPRDGRSIEELVAQVEQRAAANPDDGRAWEVLAPVYMRLGRFEDSARSWRNAIRLNGVTASRETDYGEALVAAANGMITVEAKAAFDRALALDKEDVKTRFYLGLAADQDGKRAEAEKIWRDLLTNAPPDAPWLPLVRQQLARIAPGDSPPSAPAPGPSTGEVEAAGKMSADEQKQMIGGMVARLADRLKQDGSDVDGWLRLVRAYAVLNQRDKAQAALADAKRSLAAEPDKLKRLDDLSKELGLPG